MESFQSPHLRSRSRKCLGSYLTWRLSQFVTMYGCWQKTETLGSGTTEFSAHITVRWSYWSPLIVTFHTSDAEGQGAAMHTVGLCHSQRTLRLRNSLLFVQQMEASLLFVQQNMLPQSLRQFTTNMTLRNDTDKGFCILGRLASMCTRGSVATHPF